MEWEWYYRNDEYSHYPEPALPTGPVRYGIKPGWWELEDGWYVTAGAAMKALHMGRKRFEQWFREYLRMRKVKTQTLNNPHSGRDFTVYRARDLGIMDDGKLRF